MTSTDAVGIAVAQFAPTADTAANLHVIETFVGTAAARGARVVLFPEYSSYFVDPFDETLAAAAQDVDGPFVRELIRIAGDHGVHVVAGLLERAGDGKRVRNTVVAVDGDGVCARYRKQHLYDAFGQRESDWVEPGELGHPETFEAGGLRFALMTCYDLRFPELARALVDAGAEVLVVPAAWLPGERKVDHWRTLARARAIENTCFVLACGQPEPRYCGHSLVVGPLGEDLASAEGAETTIEATLRRADLEQARATNPSLANRRL